MHSSVTVQLNGGEYPTRDAYDRSFGIDMQRATVAEKYSPKHDASFTVPSFTDLSAKLLGRRDAPPTATTNGDQSTATFVLLCGLWYMSSALSSNTGKSILNQFRYPVTLTFVQFGFVAAYCLLFMSPVVRFSRLRMPTRTIIRSTLPMGMFQVGGHMFSSIAISRIPVSTVHTIKALSPLFTVAAYALLFGVSYSTKTYMSLLPLTLGVMLACSFDVSASNYVGLLCAFGSAVVFVSSNIFFKKIMPSTPSAHGQSATQKLDKLNLLLYSSGMAFLLMIPIWLYYDLVPLLSAAENPEHVTHPKEGHATPHSVMYYFFMNGTVHFAQNIIAFVILASTSPVTYSIASLIKRVAVICIAIVWFSQSVHPVQAMGILLTFAGLYMYNQAKSDVERGEKKMQRVEAARELMLPVTKGESRMMAGSPVPSRSVTPSILQAATATGMGQRQNFIHERTRITLPPRNGSAAHPPHGHRHEHPPPQLAPLKIVPPPTISQRHSPVRETRSPSDSYPSPPLSLDSPPSVPLTLAAT
ncbi:triose-phosphate transporter family-domain-containing protein [Schizophyllum amplum]|uniref:Triose-phosphate transporter family-domain-containing protein n=1 Tax=Schizophyllum amplum TaxID=97359 RepID=A0A550CKZ1_9AGAR|nr:triose-phosphate transporter family-domain-containing protein [Auriculariopsis ampla]